MIIAAAIKYGNLICYTQRPGRHHNALHALSEVYGDVPKTDNAYRSEEQGFILDNGRFLNRREALIYAKEQGQFKRRYSPNCYDGDELFSEDLW